jgi:predicted AlkP superfamily pyrophosphatase or phosphodiesterase
MSRVTTRRALLPRLYVLACLLVCAVAAAAPADGARGPLILVSIDGFRADYLARGVTPNLAALAAAGVQAEGMRPAFPSLTFPNHYTLVTGLYPDHHGIVHNRIESEDGTSVFIYKNPETTADPAWWGGEPVWVGAERQGVRAATMFWPGSDGVIGGLRQSYWKAFDRDLSAQARVDTVLGWLDLPVAQRPGFITLYFEQADRVGHDYGPDSAELNTELASLDTALGRLLDGLAARGLREQTNLVVVSDHGQMAASRERAVLADDIVDLQQVRPVNFGVLAGFAPLPGQEREAEKLLRKHAHMQCWRRAQVPKRYRYGRNARVAPIVCLAAPGWTISSSTWFAQHADDFPRGEHGYDNDLPEMRALFIAQGPAFRSAARIGVFDNVDVYPLLMQVLGLKPAPNDGNPGTAAKILREPR